MRSRWNTIAAVALLAIGCSPERTAGPVPEARAPRVWAAVYPSWQYKVTAFPGEGVFNDVNDRNLIVGTIADTAVAMPLGGAIIRLSHGPGTASRAWAVNTSGTIAGSVNLGTYAAPKWIPAVWRRVTTAPTVLNNDGEAADINDMGVVVGSLFRAGISMAFAWDFNGTLGTGVVRLPLLPGGRFSWANAINNDLAIVGVSDSPSGMQTVVWRWSGGGWSVKPVMGGITGYDIDAGYGIVGQTSGRASFGNPDHAGFFNTIGASSVAAVNARGVATGDDAGASPGWPQYTAAFVADRSGATTYLPHPVAGPYGFAWRASYGYGINTCGLVVGTLWPFPGHPYTAIPAVWDPGC
jgi:hypothetical protein